jgi:alpha-galactosidase
MKRILISMAVILLAAGGVKAQKYDELAQTPPMGWNSWNHFHNSINEQDIKDMADAMVSNGLRDAGYTYINIDDYWHGDRDANGFMHGDTVKFPHGMKALADYVHAKGLKIGLYSDAGSKTSGGTKSGSRGHEYQDALQYARWGYDYLKYDWNFAGNRNREEAFSVMRDALREAGRPIVFSVSESGVGKPWLFCKDICQLWRTSHDIIPNFSEGAGCILSIIDANAPLRQYAGPGHWNDPDMLEVGNGLTDAQGRSHFSIWCMMAAPLILGNDLRTMSKETLATVTNKEVIAIDQDSLGVQGLRYKQENGLEVWFKPLKQGAWAMCLFNRTKEAKPYEINWSQFDFKDDVSGLSTELATKVYAIRNLWTRKAEGLTRKNRKVIVPAEDVILYKLSPKENKK